MANLVLYRKYRPQTFAEIIGQEHIVQTLTNAISSGMVSHAYLFSGPRGSGKTSIARLLAKAVNCENRKEGTAEPCNKCSSCLEIMESRSMDLIEIDAASHRGIDEIRELKDGIRFVPTKSKYKVFILDEAHQLSKDAANALLKTLEEPPAHAIFVLATTEIHKMIPTIISRCQRFDFRKLTLPEIIKRLEIISQKEKVKIEKAALELIALNSGGSIRDGESLLDQVLTFAGTLGREEVDEASASSSPFANARVIKAEDIKGLLGLVEISLVSKFCDFIAEKEVSKAINFLNDTIDKGLDLQNFTKALINYLRQALILKIAGTETANPIINRASITEFPFMGTRWKKRTEFSSPYGSKGEEENKFLFASGLTKEEFQKLEKQAAFFKEDELRNILELFLEAENKMKYSSIPQLPLELAIIEAIELTKN